MKLREIAATLGKCHDFFWGKNLGCQDLYIGKCHEMRLMGKFWEGNLWMLVATLRGEVLWGNLWLKSCRSKVCPSWYVEKTPWCLSSVLHTQPYQRNPCGPRNQKNDQQRGRVLEVVPFESLWRSAPTNPGKRWLLWARIENHDFKTMTCQWHGPNQFFRHMQSWQTSFMRTRF